MSKLATWTLAVSVLALTVTAAPAAGRDCRADADIRWFLEEREREEITLLVAWINGQLERDLLVAGSAQILAWETRLAETCADTEFVARNVHLMTLDIAAVESIPGRLFLATMERAGLRGLRRTAPNDVGPGGHAVDAGDFPGQEARNR